MKLFTLIFLFLLSCGKGASLPPPSGDPDYKTSIELVNRAESIRGWAKRCAGSAVKGDCDAGDSNLWDGLLCLSGVPESCDAVRLSQDESGRWWRSPQAKGIDPRNSFSRDMALGTAAYLLKSKDQKAAKAWEAYFSSQKQGLCPDADDGRCAVSPGLFSVLAKVWRAIGLSPTEDMKAAEQGDAFIEVLTKAAPEGFQLHLVGVQILLVQKAGAYSKPFADAANYLAHKQPGNPFFVYLKGGKTGTAVSRWLEVCSSRSPSRRNQWAWERADSEQAWKESMGWDCIFLANLLIGG